MACIKCGRELREGSSFCIHCGAKQPGGPPAQDSNTPSSIPPAGPYMPNSAPPAQPDAPFERGVQAPPQAVGGWLLLAVPSLLLDIVFLLYRFGQWTAVGQSIRDLNNGMMTFLLNAELAYAIGFPFVSALMILSLFRMKGNFPDAMHTYLVTRLVLRFLLVVFTRTALSYEYYVYDNSTYVSILLPLAAYSIWKDYCRKSKRLRATYPHSPLLARYDAEAAQKNRKAAKGGGHGQSA